MTTQMRLGQQLTFIGIVQIATGTSSGGSTSSTDSVFVFATPDIKIGSTYSADSVSPHGSYYTDLGTTSLRWKNLYLGGSGAGVATINANAGLILREASDYIITTNNSDSNNSPIEIGTASADVSKDRLLHLNTRNAYATGSNAQVASMASYGVIFSNNTNCAGIGGDSITFADTIINSVHLGTSKGRTSSNSYEVTAGGQLAVRGVADDGTSQYDNSDWITSQDLLRTSDALSTAITTLPWTATASGGDVVQVKAFIMGTDISDATLVYSGEIMGVYSISGTSSSLTVTEIGTPILNAVSSFVGTQPDCEMNADGDNVYVQVQGVATNTIQWLCSYSYHRLINVY